MTSSPARASAAPVAAALERRAARAKLLAAQTPAAEEPLRFAAGLFKAQARAAEAIEEMHRRRPLSGRLDEDAERLLDPAGEILRYAEGSGPAALAEAARSRKDDFPPTARTRLLVYWEGERAAAEDYLSRAILRPYVETLRGRNVDPGRAHRRGQCPFCGGSPWIAARRDGSTMEGARRHLGCALCGLEWSFSRILCPSCFEEDPYRLPSFQAAAHPGVRIEGCETCHRYVKSIDLSEDARPIPEVDDLASLALDLWAGEQGFVRIEPGLAGL